MKNIGAMSHLPHPSVVLRTHSTYHVMNTSPLQFNIEYIKQDNFNIK